MRQSIAVLGWMAIGLLGCSASGSSPAMETDASTRKGGGLDAALDSSAPPDAPTTDADSSTIGPPDSGSIDTGSGEAGDGKAPSSDGSVPVGSPTVILAAGDFASVSSTTGVVEAELASNPSTRLLALGDMSYTAPYESNYPWASLIAQTYPVMGNHEFNSISGTGGQTPFTMFNGKNAAKNRTFAAIKGDDGSNTYDFTYSYQVAPGWLLVVLNTGVECAQQSCATQAVTMKTWIDTWRSAQSGQGCVILAMHTARWSTMFSSSDDNLPWAPSVAPIWEAAIAEKVDIVMQGHVHVYEEFEKLDANGASSSSGAKLFTLGTGGRGQVEPPQSNISNSLLVASRASPINGVLKLALYAKSYGYKFETTSSTTAPASSVDCNTQ